MNTLAATSQSPTPNDCSSEQTDKPTTYSFAQVVASGGPALQGKAKPRATTRERILEIRRRLPALLLPMAWVSLPHGTPDRVMLVRGYLWKVFKDEYIKENGQVSEEKEESFSPFILGMLKRPNGIGIQLDSHEHLVKVLNTPLVWEETPLNWHADGGISHALIIKDVPLHIKGPRVKAALRPFGHVKKLRKLYDKAGNWSGHWTVSLTIKPNQAPPKTITFHGEKVANHVLPAADVMQ